MCSGSTVRLRCCRAGNPPLVRRGKGPESLATPVFYDRSVTDDASPSLGLLPNTQSQASPPCPTPDHQIRHVALALGNACQPIRKATLTAVMPTADACGGSVAGDEASRLVPPRKDDSFSTCSGETSRRRSDPYARTRIASWSSCRARWRSGRWRDAFPNRAGCSPCGCRRPVQEGWLDLRLSLGRQTQRVLPACEQKMMEH